ncbi:MAG: hypothetical protein FJ405_02215 [Verrucomicrobia bacterium]|nr:hypothetical protein [Verrucomicrobiota bacterium]
MKPKKTLHPFSSRTLAGCLAACSSFAISLSDVLAQEGLRHAVDGDRAQRVRQAPLQNEGDYHKAGPVTYYFGLRYALEYRDNVFASAANEQHDFIHRPGLDTHIIWQATKSSVFNFGAGVGYTKYTRLSDQDRISLAPNTSFSWDLPVKDFLFTVFNRGSYTEDVLSQGVVSGVAAFPRFDNVSGIRAAWRPDRYMIQSGYSHQIFRSTSAQFVQLNRITDSVFARAAYRFRPATMAGLEGTVAFSDYASATQPDNRSISFGPFIEWQITQFLNLTLRGGAVRYSFEADSAGAFGSSTLNSYYMGAELQHKLTDRISHSLSADKSVSLGVSQVGQYVSSTELIYGVAWRANERLSFSSDARFEDGKESRRLLSEEYKRYGIGGGVAYRITDRISPSLRYSHTQRTSDTGFGYKVNSLVLAATYRF